MTAGRWTRDGTPPSIQESWQEMMGEEGARLVPAPVLFINGQLRALVGREPANGNFDDFRWHISISHPLRVPSWEEMANAAHALRPGVVFCVPLPPRSWWINVHPHTLHIWEIRDPGMEAQWRSEARGDRPT